MTIDRNFIRAANIDLSVKRAFEVMSDALDTAVVVSGVTAVSDEINTLTGLPASMTTTATPASGTVGVQFVFKDSAAVALTHAIAGQAYFSNSTGLAIAAVTSAAVLTNGAWRDTSAGYTGLFVTDATGKLGVTVTAAAGSYYLTFVLPNGKLLTSSVLTVNA